MISKTRRNMRILLYVFNYDSRPDSDYWSLQDSLTQSIGSPDSIGSVPVRDRGCSLRHGCGLHSGSIYPDSDGAERTMLPDIDWSRQLITTVCCGATCYFVTTEITALPMVLFS